MRKFFLIGVATLVAGVYGCKAQDDDCVDREIVMASEDFVTGVKVPEKVEFAGKVYDFSDTSDYEAVDKRERLEKEMLSFKYSHQTSVLIYKKAPRYEETVKEVLREQGVPEDMFYMMVIESNLNVIARSGVGAAGFWQFMEATAREFGLEVSATVDERYDLKKSTKAACKYMKSSYQKFGDWMAVAASYNAGMGRISQSFERQGGTEVLDLWLNNETTRYMYRLMAVKLFLEQPDLFGYLIDDEGRYKPVETIEMEVRSSIADLPKWAREHGCSYKVLKMLNPWLRESRLDNKSGKLYLITLPRK